MLTAVCGMCSGVHRWLVVNLGLWGVMALALYSYMQRKNAEASDVLEISAKLNLPANIRKLKVLLSERDLKEENVEASENMQVRKVSWEEPVESPWTKHLRLYDGPIVNLTFEERHGFLLVCSLTFQKQTTPPLPHETGLSSSFPLVVIVPQPYILAFCIANLAPTFHTERLTSFHITHGDTPLY